MFGVDELETVVVGDGESVADAVWLTVDVAVRVAVAELDAVRVLEIVLDGDAPVDTVSDGVGSPLGVSDPDNVVDGVGENDGVREGVLLTDGDLVSGAGSALSVSMTPTGHIEKDEFSGCTLPRGPGMRTLASSGENSVALVQSDTDDEPAPEKGVPAGHAMGNVVLSGQKKLGGHAPEHAGVD